MAAPDDAVPEHLEASTPEQYKALGHPLRQRLLFAIGEEPATISQLAAGLDTLKGNVAHHLKVLRDAGLVRLVETRQVRGGTEHYYARTSKKLSYPRQTTVTMRAIAEEIETDPDDPLLLLRNVRLTREQADRLRATLVELVDNVEPAGSDESRYGILIGLYRPRS